MTDAASDIGPLYERHALAFDRIRGKQLIEKPWLDRFTSGLPEGDSVLDIGCGSGEPIAADLIARGYAVTGVDSSPTLIALCKERFPQGVWQVGDMRRLALGRRFDGLLAWHSFFHLRDDDQRAMFPVFSDHAASGAVLMFTSGTSAGTAMGVFEGDPLFHASLDSAEYKRLLRENGFHVEEHVVEDPACGGATVWLARKS